jgi:hypothetical protein
MTHNEECFDAHPDISGRKPFQTFRLGQHRSTPKVYRPGSGTHVGHVGGWRRVRAHAPLHINRSRFEPVGALRETRVLGLTGPQVLRRDLALVFIIADFGTRIQAPPLSG